MTGVQTCALPIYLTLGEAAKKRGVLWLLRVGLLPPGLAKQSALAELYSFSRWGWRRFFRRHGLEVVEEFETKAFFSGYGTFPLLSMGARRRLSRTFGSSSRVFLVQTKVSDTAGSGKSGRAGPGRLAIGLQRLLDVVLSVAGLVVCAPLIALTALAVFVSLGRPVLFRQSRGGHRGLVFQLCKFRTMTGKCSSSGSLLPDAERLTPVGSLVRRLSLDELPQLWNVLRGDMRLVGPRPLLAEYLPRYSAYQSRRHEVKPGITGLVQVRGRNALSWDQKLDLDVWYVDHRSKWLDLKILAITVWRVLRPEGVSQAGHATMPEFLGTQEIKDIQSTRS